MTAAAETDERAEAAQCITEYLKVYDALSRGNGKALPYPSSASFVLAHGRPMPWRPKPPAMPFQRPRQCYYNAGVMARRWPKRYRYCEGVAIGIIPTAHAWLLDQEGFVVDLTWRDYNHAYFGVEFQIDYVRKIQAPARTAIIDCYSLVDNFPMGFPLLTGLHRPAEALYAP